MRKSLSAVVITLFVVISIAACGPSKPSSPSGLDGAALPASTATPTLSTIAGQQRQRRRDGRRAHGGCHSGRHQLGADADALVPSQLVVFGMPPVARTRRVSNGKHGRLGRKSTVLLFVPRLSVFSVADSSSASRRLSRWCHVVLLIPFDDELTYGRSFGPDTVLGGAHKLPQRRRGSHRLGLAQRLGQGRLPAQLSAHCPGFVRGLVA